MRQYVGLLPGPQAPCIRCLDDGKKIATFVIDCTQLPVQNVDATFAASDDFAEQFFEWQNIRQELYTYGCDYFSFLSQEIDISNLTSGSGTGGHGMRQVNAVMCYARPGYGRYNDNSGNPVSEWPITDFAVEENVAYSSALLSNLNTHETVSLLGNNAGFQTNGEVAFSSFRFMANKDARVRFFKPVSVYELALGTQYGKFTLQLTNFDIPSCFIPSLF